MATTLSRREALHRCASCTTVAAAMSAWPLWMPRLAFAAPGKAPRGDVLVCVFLRGGADGLNIIVPHGDTAYYAARPTINVAQPDARSAAVNNRSLDLDGFFGLHPALAPLLPVFQGRQLVAVHAAGSPDPTRSHFDAMDYMERGTPGSNTVGTGWIGRHLSSLDTGNTSPLRGIGWGDMLQQSLKGSVSAIALQSIADYHLQGRDDTLTDMQAALNALYAVDATALRALADQTNAALSVIQKINVASYQPAGGARYDPNDDFGLALMQTAALIKADVGLEVAAIDVGGWDTHERQGPDLSSALAALATGLSAFHADLGDRMGGVTVVVMSEFGRRVEENASQGTDHGHGNMMLVMGGHVAPQPVIAQWPGLQDGQLDDGDLAITVDYRDVLAEIVVNRLNNPALDVVFPDYKPTMRGVTHK